MPPAGEDPDTSEADQPESGDDDPGSTTPTDPEPVEGFVFDRSADDSSHGRAGKEQDPAGGDNDPAEGDHGPGVGDHGPEEGEHDPARGEADTPPSENAPPVPDGAIGPPEDVIGPGGGGESDERPGNGTSRAFLKEFGGTVLVVVLVGMVLFAVSGVWPPMVAVKSGSMEPHMYRGDLVFVMDENRLVPEAAVAGTGVATHDSGERTGYRRFGDHGDVIVYRKDGKAEATPIIHRAQFWVNESENWFDKVNRSFVNGNSCEAIPNCPAPHAGFITKGDHNSRYDQISGISDPVKPEWIKGTAELRIPWLGHIRLELSELRVPSRPAVGS